LVGHTAENKNFHPRGTEDEEVLVLLSDILQGDIEKTLFTKSNEYNLVIN